MRCSKSHSKRDIHSNTGLLQERGRVSNNLILHLKELEKEEQMKHKVSARKEITKTMLERNKIETKKIIEKTSSTKSWYSEKDKIHKPFPDSPRKRELK